MTKSNTEKCLKVYFISVEAGCHFIAMIIKNDQLKLIMYFIINNSDKYYAQNVIFTVEIQNIIEAKLALSINFIFKSIFGKWS